MGKLIQNYCTQVFVSLDMHLPAVASSAVVANLRSIYDVTDEDLIIIIPYAVRSQVRVAPDH